MCFCLSICSSNVVKNPKKTNPVRGHGGDQRRSGRVQAVPVGAERIRQRSDVQRVAVDENRQR